MSLGLLHCIIDFQYGGMPSVTMCYVNKIDFLSSEINPIAEFTIVYSMQQNVESS